MVLKPIHDPDETEFVSVPLEEQLAADPVGPSDANALEDGDDLDLMADAFAELDALDE